MQPESPTHPDAPRAGGETPVMRATNYALAFDLLKVAGWIAAHALSGEKAEDQFAIVQRAVSHLRGESREPVQRLDELLRNDPWAAAIADHVRSALPALLDRPAPSDGWQPATTAPRSGEHILITQLGRAGFGYTDGVAQDWCAVAHYWPVAGEEGFYLSAGASSEIDDHPLSFTHWMPLPVVCLCDYSLANAPGVSHQPHCPLSSRAALLERHRDGERDTRLLDWLTASCRDLIHSEGGKWEVIEYPGDPLVEERRAIGNTPREALIVAGALRVAHSYDAISVTPPAASDGTWVDIERIKPNCMPPLFDEKRPPAASPEPTVNSNDR